jgi:Arc/MetJ family transcription regulator
MIAWQPGDPVGTGALYLPTKEDRLAYGMACRAAIIESAARHAISLGSLQLRRDFIDAYPDTMRDALKARIKQIWETRTND